VIVTTTWLALVRTSTERLRDAAVEAPDVEARWIVEHASGLDAAELAGVGAEPATRRASTAVEAMVARRVAGEPLQYVLGAWPFREFDLLVDRRVLIPRPETEVVAQVAIDAVAALGARRGRPDPWAGRATEYVVADLGTGSGALALALAGSLPDAEVWATDVSADALAVARANFAGAGLPATRIRSALGSWFDALPATLHGRLRMVVANPPYVSEAEFGELPDVVARWEPRESLVSGATGLEAITSILADATRWLEPGGIVVCELAPHQADAAVAFAERVGLADVTVERDLTGRERVLVARRTG
jgi:release factor glutamine methyltransferase